jgi:hypothetical protein
VAGVLSTVAAIKVIFNYWEGQKSLVHRQERCGHRLQEQPPAPQTLPGPINTSQQLPSRVKGITIIKKYRYDLFGRPGQLTNPGNFVMEIHIEPIP